jgi:hypothetical protein
MPSIANDAVGLGDRYVTFGFRAGEDEPWLVVA